MSLQLDARQRAMLAQMGVVTFMPQREVDDAVAVEEPVVARAPAAARAVTAPEQSPMREQPVVARAPMPAPHREPVARGPIDSMDWDELAQTVAACRACSLCERRRNTVFGVGDTQADWLIVGEAPGEQEDAQGEPFVGAAGKLLDNMLKALGLSRTRNVYIANVLKCRPPGNRNPEPAEVAQCEPYLRRQVELLKPKIILAMGRFAVQALLNTDEPIGRLRGRRHEYMGIPVVVTYHPAYLLRTLPDKAKAWADLCLAQELTMGLRASGDIVLDT